MLLEYDFPEDKSLWYGARHMTFFSELGILTYSFVALFPQINLVEETSRSRALL